jgi:hypothetical protein
VVFKESFVLNTFYATALSGALKRFITLSVMFLVLLFTLNLQSKPVIPLRSFLYIGKTIKTQHATRHVLWRWGESNPRPNKNYK